jgi:hypothetical protein
MKIINIITFISLLTMTLLFMAPADLTQAQITNPVIGELGNNYEEAKDGTLFTQYFVLLWKATISIGALLVIVFFIWGAIDWIAAGGDSGKLEKARQKMMHSAIGLIILVASFTLIGLLGDVLFGEEFSLLEISLPSALKENTP